MVIGTPLISTDETGGAPPTGTVGASEVGSLVLQLATAITTDVSTDTDVVWEKGFTQAWSTSDPGAVGSVIFTAWMEATGSTGGWGAAVSGDTEPSASAYVALPVNRNSGPAPAFVDMSERLLITGHDAFTDRGTVFAGSTLFLAATVLGDTPPEIVSSNFEWTKLGDPIVIPGGTLTIWTAFYPPGNPTTSLDLMVTEVIDSGVLVSVG